MPDSSSTTSPMGASLSDLLFSFVLEKYIVCEVCGLRSPSFESSSVLHISPTDTPSMQNLILEGCNRNCKNPVLDAIRTLSTSNRAIYCNLQNTYFSLLIDLDTLIIISSKIDAPYLWIRPLCLVPWNLTCRLLLIIMDHLLIPVITLHLSIVAKKHSIATITKLRSLELLIKTPLLHILYYINGLTHDFWTRTGGWEFDRSHGAGTSSPSHWQQVEEQAPKPVGWTMCFLLMTLVPAQKLCVNIYVYICVHSLYEFCYRSYIQRECHSVLAKLHPITFYRGVRGSWSECHFVFSLVYQLCLALWSQSITRMLVTLGICLKQYFDTRYLVFYNTSPPRMFLSLDLLWEYRIQHGANGPLYVTSSYSTWIFCKGVSGFATDCPCGVWCRGLTTCLLHVDPPFGNRILNNSWAVGLT